MANRNWHLLVFMAGSIWKSVSTCECVFLTLMHEHTERSHILIQQQQTNRPVGLLMHTET